MKGKNKVFEKSPFKRRQKLTEDEIVKVRPASLVGAADFLRKEYAKQGQNIDVYWLILKNPETGEVDTSRPYSSLTEPRQRRSKSRIAQLKNENRRIEYRKSSDIEKKGKTPIVSQRVTATKGRG